jgi:hypothetical protein
MSPAVIAAVSTLSACAIPPSVIMIEPGKANRRSAVTIGRKLNVRAEHCGMRGLLSCVNHFNKQVFSRKMQASFQ